MSDKMLMVIGIGHSDKRIAIPYNEELALELVKNGISCIEHRSWDNKVTFERSNLFDVQIQLINDSAMKNPLPSEESL